MARYNYSIPPLPRMPKRRNASGSRVYLRKMDQNELPEVRVLTYIAAYARDAYAPLLREFGALNAARTVVNAANVAEDAEGPEEWEQLRSAIQAAMRVHRGHSGLSAFAELLIFQITEDALGEDPGDYAPER